MSGSIAEVNQAEPYSVAVGRERREHHGDLVAPDLCLKAKGNTSLSLLLPLPTSACIQHPQDLARNCAKPPPFILCVPQAIALAQGKISP